MSGFSQTKSIGFSWAPDGSFVAVRVARKGNRFSVLAAEANSSDEEARNATLAVDVLKAVQGTENDICVAGGKGALASFVDVILPKLRMNDLRDALVHEVQRHAPVNAEELVWAYRVLPHAEKDKLHVRLFFLRQTTWNHWLDIAGSLRRGVDIVLPPLATLDPLLENRNVALPSIADDTEGFLFVPTEQGQRELLPYAVNKAEPDTFGALPDPLSGDEIADLGPLSNLSEQEKLTYVEPLLLAMYGTTPAVEKDRRTWLPVPYEIKPKRHRLAQALTILLVGFVILAGAFGLWREYDNAARYMRRLQERIAAMQEELEASQPQPVVTESLDQLKNELQSDVFHQPQLARCLKEITRLVDDTAWAKSLRWDEGQINLELTSDESEIDVVDSFEESPLFTDVVLLRKTRTSRGQLNVTIKMFAVPQQDLESAAHTAEEPDAPGPIEEERENI